MAAYEIKVYDHARLRILIERLGAGGGVSYSVLWLPKLFDVNRTPIIISESLREMFSGASIGPIRSSRTIRFLRRMYSSIEEDGYARFHFDFNVHDEALEEMIVSPLWRFS